MDLNPVNVSFTFTNKHLFKIRPDQQYDLVWAAGLFDYLEDRPAGVLLKRMWNLTKDGGQLVVGNFHPRNPNRNMMEWVGDWFLIHRTEQDFLELCHKSNISEKSATFEQEPLGSCIFLIVKKGLT